MNSLILRQPALLIPFDQHFSFVEDKLVKWQQLINTGEDVVYPFQYEVRYLDKSPLNSTDITPLIYTLDRLSAANL